MLNEIQVEFDKVREKDRTTKRNVRDMIANLKDELIELDNKLDSVNNSMADESTTTVSGDILTQSINKIQDQDVIKNFNTVCNNFYGGLTKLGKIMAKNLESENIENLKLYDYDKNLLYKIIVKDLYRRGDFSTADSLIKESKIPFDQNFRFIFNDLNTITRDLKSKNIETLIEWCVKYKAHLEKNRSSLHFESLKLKFILVFKTQPASSCVEYSKKFFQDYINDQKYFDQISKLLTLLIFKGNMKSCPYTEFDEEILWNKITNMFINDCCTILGNLSLFILN
jgi:hypothetical protein